VSAATSASPAAPRRDRALRFTVAAFTGAKVFSVLCTLAQVPIALRYLGTEAYGLWIALISLTTLFNFVDFGLGVGMQRVMAEAFGQDDDTTVRRAFFSGAAALTLLALATVVIGLPIALFFDWGTTLRITEPTLFPQTGAALALTLCAWALALPLNAVSRLAAAVQRGWLHAGWIAAGSALTLAATAWAAHSGWGFLAFLAAATLVPVAQGLGLWIHLWIALHWPWRGAALLPRSALRELLGTSALFSPAQLGLALAQAAPPLALTLAAGPTAATAFNLLQRLFSPLAQAQVIIFTPLWPALAEAHTRGDAAWIRRTGQRALLATAALALTLPIVTAFAPELIRWWIGPATILPATSLAWFTCAWAILQLAVLALMYFLVALGRLRAVALHLSLGCALALAGLFGFTRLGANIALLAGCAGLALALPGLALATRRAWPALTSAKISAS
jgi:O-antigen/teichoic acid export membrane protein